MTSSALDRAVETADIIQGEIEAELAWVDFPCAALPDTTRVRVVQATEEFVEVLVLELPAPVSVVDDDNLLQPRAEVAMGSRLRVRTAKALPASITNQEVLLSEIVQPADKVAVHHILANVQRLDPSRFEEWECSGCDAVSPVGSIHWSDDAENNGLGFCDACFKKGPTHKKLKTGDSLARVTEGIAASRFRMPNDPNLNEAAVDIIANLEASDPLFPYYGELNAQILKDRAQAATAFHTHMHRSVNHKGLKREKRLDTLALHFTNSSGEQQIRHWTVSECKALEITNSGECPWIWDCEAKGREDGPFTLCKVVDEDVTGCPGETVRAALQKQIDAHAKKGPGRQIELLVCHGNMIRFMFLKGLQFDTTAWLNLGGSNCTMTQLRITRKGDVICDFFANHGSKLPVTHYTYNKHADV
jgi:serine/threonine-protein phosphatase PGAM5